MAEEPQFVAPPEVEAGWLVCRLWQPGEAGVLHEAVTASLDHLLPWMSWARDYTRATTEDFLARNARAADGAPVADAAYGVWDREGRLLGSSGLHGRLGAQALEIGYWVDVRHTRRGVATLTAAVLTEAALSVAGVEAVEIHHDEANTRSAAVPAKLGYERVAVVPDEAVAPSEIGVEWQWRTTKDGWPASAGAQLLAAARSGATFTQ